MATRIEYRSGGDLAAGLFSIEEKSGRTISTKNVVRLAWWPTGIEPTAYNIDRVVVELVWGRGVYETTPITKEQIIELFRNQIVSRMEPVRGAYRRRG